MRSQTETKRSNSGFFSLGFPSSQAPTYATDASLAVAVAVAVEKEVEEVEVEEEEREEAGAGADTAVDEAAGDETPDAVEENKSHTVGFVSAAADSSHAARVRFLPFCVHGVHFSGEKRNNFCENGKCVHLQIF